VIEAFPLLNGIMEMLYLFVFTQFRMGSRLARLPPLF
jgi:hypothetical protein